MDDQERYEEMLIMAEEFELGPEDEQLLDHIWQEIHAREETFPPLPPAPAPVHTPLPYVSFIKQATLESCGGNDQSDEISQLHLSPDGARLVIDDFTHICLWDISHRPTLLARIENTFGSTPFTPDSQTFVLLSQQQTIHVISREGVLLRQFGPHQNQEPAELKLSSNGSMLITLPLDEQEPVRLKLSSDGSMLITLPLDENEGIVWSMQGESIAVLVGPHQYPLVDACFSPEDRYCATLDQGGTLCLWEVATWRPIVTRDSVTGIGRGNHLQWSANGSQLAYCGNKRGESRLILWHVKDLIEGEHPVVFGREYVHQCMVDGRLLADIGGDTIHWYELPTRKYLGTFMTPDLSSLVHNPSPWPIPLALSPDGRYVAIGDTYDGKVWLWDIEHQQVLTSQAIFANTRNHRIGRFASHVFYSLLWHPQRNLLITAGEDPGSSHMEAEPSYDDIIRSVKLWEIAISAQPE